MTEEEKREERKSKEERRYRRREFFKKTGRGAQIAGTTATYGIVSAAFGRGYRLLKTAYEGLTTVAKKAARTPYDLNQRAENKVDEMAESKDSVIRATGKAGKKVKDTSSRVEDWRRRLFGISKENQKANRERIGIKEPKEKPKASYPLSQKAQSPQTQEKTQGIEEKTNRRGFFTKLFKYADQNPEATGATVGTVYGAGKGVLRDRRGRTIRRLERDIRNLKRQGNYKPKDLEESVDREEAEEDEDKKIPPTIILGLAGIVLAIILSATKLTGFSILGNSKLTLSNLVSAVFIISLFLILFGVIKKV